MDFYVCRLSRKDFIKELYRTVRTTWKVDFYRLPLWKPSQSFKPSNTIKPGVLFFSEFNMSPRRLEKAKKISKNVLEFSALRPPSFLIFRLVSSTLWPFEFSLSVTANNAKSGDFYAAVSSGITVRETNCAIHWMDIHDVRIKARPKGHLAIKLYI